MSRITRWKTEKTKVKVVFRLQFRGTNIPHPGWDKLFVSFIPADTGKPSAKTNKASVRNGSCKWSDPIYETTRLLQDSRSKIYDGKLYKLVATGSSRSSFLGEVTINLADFADALKPSSAALPLDGCEFLTVLHATVQLLTSKTGFREFDRQRELGVQILQMPNHHNQDLRGATSASLEASHENTDKAKARVRFKEEAKDLPSLEEVGELTEEYEDSAVGIEGSSYTSDSAYAEKNDIAVTDEMDGIKSTSESYKGGFPLSMVVRS